MPVGIKALILDSDGNRRALIQEPLANIGYSTVGCIDHVNQLSEQLGEQADKQHFDILIVCQTRVYSDFLERLKQTLAGCTVPVMMMSEDNSVEALNQTISAGMHAYMVLGVQSNCITFSVDIAFATFRVIQAMQQQITQLENTLQSRIIIEKARGVIMKNRQLDGDRAYVYLRNYSMDRGLKIVDIAQMINETEKFMNAAFTGLSGETPC